MRLNVQIEREQHACIHANAGTESACVYLTVLCLCWEGNMQLRLYHGVIRLH